MFTGIRSYQNSHLHGTSSLLGVIKLGDIKISTLMNFKLTWNVHTGKEITTFPPPCSFKLTWNVHEGEKITKFPPHGTSSWFGMFLKGKKDIKNAPQPCKLQVDLECFTRVRRYQNFHLLGTSRWPWKLPPRKRRYPTFHPHGTSSWLGEFHKGKKISKGFHPGGTSSWLGMFTRVFD